jgi:glutathione reductase (NADPH)
VESFDLIVLGGGSGGLATAQRAAEYGARPLLFEPARLGGTCVNVGCVPKKVMWNAAELAASIEEASHYGFKLSAGGHDWHTLKTGRDAYVKRLNEIYARNLERKGIPVVKSRAHFRGPNEVVDEDGRTYRAEHVVIATGGYPDRPSLPGAATGITSDGFFELEALPKRVAIVGSGYIAVELGGVLHALGSEVSLFMRFGRLLRGFDSMLSEELMTSMDQGGIDLVRYAVPRAVTQGESIELELEDGRRSGGFDMLLWAIGRSPNTAGLNLKAAGVDVSPLGYVIVDAYQNTNVEGIYALGDVTGLAELTPVAIAAGRRLADRVFGGQPDRHLSYDCVPTVIFSHPPIGTIGLTEEQAQREHGVGHIRVYRTEFVPMFNALTERKPRTAMKLITAGAEERIVGCHIIGAGADEMLQGFAVAITMGARKSDFDDTVAIHPTSAEELVTMR